MNRSNEETLAFSSTEHHSNRQLRHGSGRMLWKPGDRLLENYIVKRMIGCGGNGTVYQVYHSDRPDIELAVKTIRSDLMHDPQGLEGLLNELQLWSDLPPHSNIVKCRFFRTLAGTPLIFSEFVGGGTLKRWFMLGKIKNLKTVLEIAIQIAEGLRVAHHAGLIHLDIKPGNIMMTREGQAKLTDFGLARSFLVTPSAEPTKKHVNGFPVSSEANATPAESNNVPSTENTVVRPGTNTEPMYHETTHRGLTPQYCSPELAERKGEVDHRSDIWSWSLVILELLVGAPMWSYGAQASTWIKTASPEMVKSQYKDSVTGELWQLLSKCINKNPADRFSSFDGVQLELIGLYEKLTGSDYPGELINTSDLGLPEHKTELHRSLGSGLAWDSPEFWVKKAKATQQEMAAYSIRLPVVSGISRRVRLMAELRGFVRVLKTFRAVYEQIESEPFARIYTGALIDASQVQFALEDFRGSEDMIFIALDISKKWMKSNGEDFWKGQYLNTVINFVGSLRNQGQFAQAKKMLQEAEGLVDVDLTKDISAEILEKVLRFHEIKANLHSGLREFDTACSILRGVIGYIETITVKPTLTLKYMLPMAYQGLASNLSLSGQSHSALTHMEKAASLIDEIPDEKQELKLYCQTVIFSNMGQILNKTGDPNALSWLNKAIECVEFNPVSKMIHVRSLLRCLLSKATYYSRKNDQEMNLQTLTKLNKEINYQIYINGRTDLLLESLATGANLSAVLYKLGQYRESLETAQRCCNQCDHIQQRAQRKDIRWIESAVRLTMGAVLMELKEYPGAEIQLRLAIASRQQHEKEEKSASTSYSTANAMVTLASLLILQGKTDQALEIAETARENLAQLNPAEANMDQMIIRLGAMEVYLNCLINSGRSTEALEHSARIEREIDVFHKGQYKLDEVPASGVRFYEARALADAGRMAEAVKLANELRLLLARHSDGQGVRNFGEKQAIVDEILKERNSCP